MDKTFTIHSLKTELFIKWLDDNGLEEIGNDTVFDSGQVYGVQAFLDFIENEWNKNNKS